MDLVAVVTINRNNNRDVLNLFDSLKQQDYTNWVFIVIDDNSDNLNNLLSVEDNRLIIIKFPTPFSFAYAKKFNFAYTQAINYKATYILKLHTDMSITSNSLIKLLVDQMKLNEKVVCVGPRIFDGNGLETWGPGIIKKRCGHEFTVHECYLIKSAYLIEFQGFQDENFTWFGEEMDFFTRIYKNGFKTSHADASITHYGGATSSSFINKKKFYRTESTLLFLHKHNRNYSFYMNFRWYLEEISDDFFQGLNYIIRGKLMSAGLLYYYQLTGIFSALYKIITRKVKRLK